MIQTLKLCGALLVITLLCSCATYMDRCKSWQRQGLIYSTLESCRKCVGQLGDGNVNTIQGCALGMDAASLIPK